jgi:hypothetical protein
MVAVEQATKWLTEVALEDPTLRRAFVRYAANQGGLRWERWAAACGKVGDDPSLAGVAALALSTVVSWAHRQELDRLTAVVEARQVLGELPPGMV